MQTIVTSLFAGLCVGLGYGYLFQQRAIRAFRMPMQASGAGQWLKGFVFSFFVNYVLIFVTLVLLMRRMALDPTLTLVALLVGFGYQVFRLRSME